MSSQQIITFTTDFGLHDHYVGTIKGVALSIVPSATLVDICHEVRSYDVLDGALTIAQAYRYFPAATVHVVVVDPGVGGARRPIVAEVGQQIFVCPDNGVLSFVYQREQPVSVRHIVNDRYFLQPVSSTFHGRDIFAPVAAHIAAGVPIDEFGPPILDYATLELAAPKRVAQGVLAGTVLKVDKFGNVITNITPADISDALGPRRSFRLKVGNASISNLRTSYAGAAPGQLFSIFDSLGYLEIAANQASAAEQLRITQGDAVEVIGLP